MRYLIDGYNLLFRLTEGDISITSDREELISFLKHHTEIFHLECSIAFEGREREVPSTLQSGIYFNVIYTPDGQSVDDYIIELLSYKKRSPDLTIVTSDKKLANEIHFLGFKTLPVENFINRLLKKKKKPSSQESKHSFEETTSNLKRLEKIFKERLRFLNRDD